MKIFRAVLFFAALPCCHAQAKPSVYVTSSPESTAAALPTLSGPAPVMITTPGDFGRDVTNYLRRGCHTVTTTSNPASADFIFTLDRKVWELRDRQGKIVFTTKHHVMFIGIVAKNVCDYFKSR